MYFYGISCYVYTLSLILFIWVFSLFPLVTWWNVWQFFIFQKQSSFFFWSFLYFYISLGSVTGNFCVSSVVSCFLGIPCSLNYLVLLPSHSKKQSPLPILLFSLRERELPPVSPAWDPEFFRPIFRRCTCSILLVSWWWGWGWNSWYYVPPLGRRPGFFPESQAGCWRPPICFL